MAFRLATPADAAAISRLVQESFLEFVAPDWEQHAVERFLRDSSPTELASFIATADFAAVAVADKEPIGFILLAPANMLKALFVHKSCHKRGVSRQLWSMARGHLKSRHPQLETIELNASDFAVEAYKALGFHPISKPLLRNGSRSTRMACWLPSRDE